MHNAPIGILDSGIGGLTIWQEIIRLLPEEATLYLADSANCPYGIRSPEEIYTLAKRLVDYLMIREVKMLVLACNTITVTSLERLRQDFPQLPIIGTVPVIKTAVAETKNGRIGILSTEMTARSDYQHNLIAQFAGECEVINIGTNELVPFIENGDVTSNAVRDTLQVVLAPFREKQVDTLALGCSHYPFLTPVIQEIMGTRVRILDSGTAIARQVARVLLQNNVRAQTTTPRHVLLTTGTREYFQQVVSNLIPDKPQQVEIREAQMV